MTLTDSPLTLHRDNSGHIGLKRTLTNIRLQILMNLMKFFKDQKLVEIQEFFFLVKKGKCCQIYEISKKTRKKKESVEPREKLYEEYQR